MFMLLLVPEPVWKTSIGNWSSCAPPATSSAAAMIASASSASIEAVGQRLTDATAALIRASASICDRSSPRPEIGKFSTARWVWAPHFAAGGDPDLAHRVPLDAGLGVVGHRLKSGSTASVKRMTGGMRYGRTPASRSSSSLPASPISSLTNTPWCAG